MVLAGEHRKRLERELMKFHGKEIDKVRQHLQRMEEISERGGPDFRFHIQDALMTKISEIVDSHKELGISRKSKKFYWKRAMDSLLTKGFAVHPGEVKHKEVGAEVRKTLENLTSGDLYELTRKFYKETQRDEVLIGKKGSKTKVFKIVEIEYKTREGKKKKIPFLLFNPEFFYEY